ncbi:hypothetical protein QUB08_19675 [Microcoleus sp. BR0-C5]|uniref:hypothetical protein n=1 Tax=Microcoleus sp. BR0-C5 TaxID=2818713 RepID=UPI002FD64C32
MVLKISPIAQTKHSPLNLWDGRPARTSQTVGWASRPSSVFSQPATHSPAFSQSHAAEKPDRP